MAFLKPYVRVLLRRWYTLLAAFVFDVLLSVPAIKHAVSPEQQAPDVPWFGIVAVTIVALVIAQVWAGCDLLRQRDEAKATFLNNRPIVDVFATPSEVNMQHVFLDVQNIGKIAAHVTLIEIWVQDSDTITKAANAYTQALRQGETLPSSQEIDRLTAHYANDTGKIPFIGYYTESIMFPLPPGGVNDKRGVQCDIQPAAVDCPMPMPEDGVVVQIHWSDAENLQTWDGEFRFYPKKTVFGKAKQWEIKT